jgi:hypothetical protein
MIKTFWHTIKDQLIQWKDDHLAPQAINWKQFDDWDKTLATNKPLTKWFTRCLPNVDDDIIGIPYPKNRTLRFWGIDTPNAFKQVKDNPNGFSEDNVKYTFNQYGFRGDDPDLKTDYTILVAGCSHTFGVGLDDSKTWVQQFKDIIPKKVVIKNGIKTQRTFKIINISISGASNDYIARALLQCTDIIKPNCIIACYTYDARREAILLPHNGQVLQMTATVPDTLPGDDEIIDEYKGWFMTMHDESNHYNWDKNREIVKLLCRANNIDLIETHVGAMKRIQRSLYKELGFVDLARDAEHFGPHTHKKFAQEMMKQWISLQD